MKTKTHLVALALLAIFAGSLSADVPLAVGPTIEFGGGGSAELTGWTYDAPSRMFTFGPTIGPFQAVLGSDTDALFDVDAWLELPNLLVGGDIDSGWTLTPQGNIFINYSGGTLMEGVLGLGDLIGREGGTTAGAYTVFQVDINVVSASNPIGSDAMDQIMKYRKLDFDLTFNGIEGGVVTMLQATEGQFHDGLSGSITVVPAPGAILLGGIGTSVVGWLRRRRSL